MKTFQEFTADATWSIENLVLEQGGFKDQVKKRKKDKGYQSKRSKKIKRLRNDPNHWSGLETVESWD